MKRVCINCGREITTEQKVHVSPFCFLGLYSCICGLVGTLIEISKTIEEIGGEKDD